MQRGGFGERPVQEAAGSARSSSKKPILEPISYQGGTLHFGSKKRVLQNFEAALRGGYLV